MHSPRQFRQNEAIGCPPDVSEYAETYCFDRLSPEDARTFEEHFLHCRACAMEVREARNFVSSIRAALAQLEDSLARPKARAQCG